MAVKVAASAFIFEVSHIFPNIFSNDDQKGVENLSLKDSTFAMFKSNFGERDKVFRLISYASSFSLFDTLIATQNKVAP